METILHNLTETDAFAASVLATLAGNKEGATVLGLKGDLGSGKTAFTKGLARALGVTHEVLSPTFVIAKFYPLSRHDAFTRLIHVDLYRLETPEELNALGWEALLADPKNLIVVEWPELGGDRFPEGGVLLQFRFIDEVTRGVTRL